MNRIAEDLYPMRVNPNNFSKGDAVKKIVNDAVQTPYVGVVTRPVPSTNKVEVNWPHGMGMEDPWDLVKVNPILNPPVVDEDKSYKTYQNTTAPEEHRKSLKHYTVMEDFLSENVQPVMVFSSALYNDGFSKTEAYTKLSSKFDNEAILDNILDKVYSASYNVRKATDIYSEDEYRFAELKLEGDCNYGFKVSYIIDGDSTVHDFKNPIAAVDCYKEFEQIINALDSSADYSSVVAKVIKDRETEGMEGDL